MPVRRVAVCRVAAQDCEDGRVIPAHVIPPRARVPTATYLALAGLDTWLAGQRSPRRRRLRLMTKPALMPTLMAAFARASEADLRTEDEPRDRAAAPPRGALRAGALAAQALSGAGDVALLSHRDRAFLGGIGAFFGAHLAYTATFVAHGRPLTDTTNRSLTLATAAFGAALAPAVGWAARRRRPALQGPVSAYAAMITTMVASSTRLGEDVPAAARRSIGVGTGLFMVSDSLIAARKFVLRDPKPRSDAVVMATYTAGQGLIALGLAQAARAPRPASAAPPARVEETDG